MCPCSLLLSFPSTDVPHGSHSSGKVIKYLIQCPSQRKHRNRPGKQEKSLFPGKNPPWLCSVTKSLTSPGFNWAKKGSLGGRLVGRRLKEGQSRLTCTELHEAEVCCCALDLPGLTLRLPSEFPSLMCSFWFQWCVRPKLSLEPGSKHLLSPDTSLEEG